MYLKDTMYLITIVSVMLLWTMIVLVYFPIVIFSSLLLINKLLMRVHWGLNFFPANSRLEIASLKVDAK